MSNEAKQTILELVVKHRNGCDGDCALQLHHTLEWLEKAGMKFSEDEREWFL